MYRTQSVSSRAKVASFCPITVVQIHQDAAAISGIAKTNRQPTLILPSRGGPHQAFLHELVPDARFGSQSIDLNGVQMLPESPA